MKRIISVFLVVLLLSASSTVLARASDQLDSYSITISAQGSGKVKVTVNVEGTHNKMTKIGFPSISLYEQNGSTWTLVANEYSKYNSNATAGSHTFTFTYQGTTGKYYYASSSFFAQDAKGSDSRSATSPTVKAT